MRCATLAGRGAKAGSGGTATGVIRWTVGSLGLVGGGTSRGCKLAGVGVVAGCPEEAA
ncbi:MAG: hypothetical protein JOZ66_12545 [Hyphomicrobiales bacterium]|nr:hypothetical protein [Hyphomicrobiales bacterium]